MTEYETLDLMASVGADQTILVGQIVGLHLALVAGVYYFLHKSGWTMKGVVFVLHTLGFATFVAVRFSQSAFFTAGAEALAGLSAQGTDLSRLGRRIADSVNAPGGGLPSILFNLALAAMWGGSSAFLFFWKRPTET